MATNLSKLFVTVADAKVNDFLAAYGPSATSRANTYDSKIVFLGSTGQIFTQGQLYGAAATDVSELKAILAGFDSDGSDVNMQTVAAAITAAKNAVLGTAETSSAETQTVGAVSDRVKAIENLIGATADSDTTINKLQEVLDWFAGVDEAAAADQVGAALIADVAANKTAIGAKGVVAETITAEAYNALSAEAQDAYELRNSEYVKKGTGTAATGLYKEIEDAKTAAIAAQHTKTKVTAGTTNGTISVDDGEDIIIFTPEAETQLSVKTGSSDYVAVSDHEIEIKTTGLGTAVGLTKKYKAGDAEPISETDYAALAADAQAAYSPIWVKADGTVASGSGLATAADVAQEIVANEEVIAAALNDHESRIQSVEKVADELDNSVTTIVNDTTNKSDYVQISAAATETGDSANDHRYKLEVTEATYTAATDTAAATISDGIVTASTLNSVLGSLWETYSE